MIVVIATRRAYLGREQNTGKMRGYTSARKTNVATILVRGSQGPRSDYVVRAR